MIIRLEIFRCWNISVGKVEYYVRDDVAEKMFKKINKLIERKLKKEEAKLAPLDNINKIEDNKIDE